MIKYVLWRIAVALPLLLGTTAASFAVLQLIPGSPLDVIIPFGTASSPSEVAQITAQLGLNKPVYMQYLLYLWHILQGNLGTSYINSQTVDAEIRAAIPYTAELTGGAMLVTLVVGIPIGMVGALRRGTIVDRLLTSLAVLGIAVPYFWLGLLLVLLFAVHLHWFPALGAGSLRSLILPAVSLGIGYAAFMVRLFKASLIDELRKPYVRFSRARGVPSSRIFLHSVVKASAGPVMTGIGIQFGNMISGAAATEVIFGRPGIGSLFVQSILAKDIPTVQGLIVLVTAVYIVVNLLVDVGKAAIDPRVRLHLTGQTI